MLALLLAFAVACLAAAGPDRPHQPRLPQVGPGARCCTGACAPSGPPSPAMTIDPHSPHVRAQGGVRGLATTSGVQVDGIPWCDTA